MSQAKPENVRNIGIIAHIDAGKTTLTERFLYYTGKTHRLGDVDEGNTVTDWMDQEQERGITITAAVVDCPWKHYDIHLIDTPGHVDFTIEVERSLRVLDGAVVVINAVDGVEPQTETVWRQADRHRVPRLVFVNKMDRMGASFEKSVSSLTTLLDAKPVPIQIPWGVESDFVGSIDLIKQVGLRWTGEELGARFLEEPIPAELQAEAAAARESMISAIADHDEEIANLYLAEEPIPTDLLNQAIRRLTLQTAIFPVLCGTALRNKGVQPLLDAVGAFLPSPLDLPPIQGIHPQTQEPLQRAHRPKEHTAALVFKVMMDEGRRLCYFRVYSGKIKEGDALYNPRRRDTERIARLFIMQGGKKIRVEEIPAGFFGAARGLKDATTGDTLCDPQDPILLEEIHSQEPVIMVAIEPDSSKDKADLDQAVKKLCDEDPTLRFREDEDTGQMILSGMGELHLDVICTRLLREFKVNVRVGNPQVVYRETILKSAEEEHIFHRDIEDIHLFAGVKLRVAPMPRGQGNLLLDQIPPEQILQPMWKEAIHSSIRDAFEGGGVLAGYPLVDTQVTLLSVQIQEPQQATFPAWKAATSQALQKALQAANPIMLEPIVAVEVVVPDDGIGDVIGDLNSRRALIQEIEPRSGKSVVRAHSPLKQMFGYTTQLRSMTQGRGSFTMSFHSFDSTAG